MIFEQIAVGGDANFSYLVGEGPSGQAVVIDPAFKTDEILARAQKHNLSICFVVNTHSHYDHTAGNDTVLEKTGAVLAGYGLKPPAKSLRNGDTLQVGALTLQVIHTPGHTDDSICILAENKLVSGDTLLVGTIGRTGFRQDSRQIYESLYSNIMLLPDNIEVYPGHDYGPRPTSTIGREKQENPFLNLSSFEEFLDLKRRRRSGIY